MVMGRSLDLNGTTILIACLFWGYLWGLVGLGTGHAHHGEHEGCLPNDSRLNRWAELMSWTGSRRFSPAQARVDPMLSSRPAISTESGSPERGPRPSR